jgi:hypothetical protein
MRLSDLEKRLDASKLPEERFFQVVGIEAPSAPGIRKIHIIKM